MDKRIESNIEVKEKLTDALFSLLEERHISEITVTMLIEKASVARVSFYRNFSSLEDILRYQHNRLIDSYFEECAFPNVDFSNPEYMAWMFGFYRKYKQKILALQRNGLSSMTLETINHIAITHPRFKNEKGPAPIQNNRIDFYFEAGAFYNIVIHWLADPDPVPAETLAQQFCQKIIGSASA